MTIAELFVNIGIKGADKTVKSLGTVEKGLGSIASSSLAAKAGIAAVIFGLERLTGFASQVGMDLHKFNVTTGLSAQELQKWQYAAMLFDVSGEEMTSTIKGVQSAMSDMLLGKGAPQALGMLAEKVGFDPKRARDTFYVMSKIQEFAKTQPPDIANNMLKSFGISDNVFQMLKTMDLQIDKIRSKDILDSRQISRLTEVNKEWKKFWFTLKMMGTRLVSEHGVTAVRELGNAFKFLTSTADDVQKLSKAFPVLRDVAVAAALAIAAAFAPVTMAVAGILLLLSQVQKYRDGKESIFGEAGKPAGPMSWGSKAMQYVTGDGLSKDASSLWNKITGAKEETKPTRLAMPLPAYPGDSKAAPGRDVQISNTFHIDGSHSPQDTAKVIQKVIEDAFYKSTAQAGGT